MKILRNSAHCKKCDTDIESKFRHDWQRCDCGAIFVDGGKDYLRAGGELRYYENTSLFDDDPQHAVDSGQNG